MEFGSFLEVGLGGNSLILKITVGQVSNCSLWATSELLCHYLNKNYAKFNVKFSVFKLCHCCHPYLQPVRNTTPRSYYSKDEWTATHFQTGRTLNEWSQESQLTPFPQESRGWKDRQLNIHTTPNQISWHLSQAWWLISFIKGFGFHSQWLVPCLKDDGSFLGGAQRIQCRRQTNSGKRLQGAGKKLWYQTKTSEVV